MTDKVQEIFINSLSRKDLERTQMVLVELSQSLFLVSLKIHLILIFPPPPQFAPPPVQGLELFSPKPENILTAFLKT